MSPRKSRSSSIARVRHDPLRHLRREEHQRPHDSVSGQQRECKALIDQYDERTIIGTFGEAEASGWSGNRGPELETTLGAAMAAADKHGSAELCLPLRAPGAWLRTQERSA